MALNFCKLTFLRRMMSTTVNTKLVDTLSQSKIASKLGNVNDLLQSTPELNNFPPELFQSTYDFLRTEGFSSQKFASIISRHPKVLSTPQEKIFDAINNWRAYQFGERETISLLSNFPELLEMPHNKDLIAKLNLIKSYIGGGANISRMLQNSPVVLTQSLTAIREKIDYFNNVMKVESAEVMTSAALSADFSTIKVRHIFLQRLGLFVVKKKRDASEVSKNPKLSQITDTSDKRFATKVCHVTVDEFETFQELYQREQDRNPKKDEDFEGEEDDDDEEIHVKVKTS